MGSFTFKWTQPAEEVYVTGSFDNWEKSTQLEKVGDSFEKTVELPEASEKIIYKETQSLTNSPSFADEQYVVDNKWVTDNSAPLEKDHEGNDNNVLPRDQLKKSAPQSAAIMSGVTPESTTAKMAADVPLEKAPESDAPATNVVSEKAAEVKEEAEKVVEEKKPELSEKVAAAEEKAEQSKPTENLATPDAVERVETPSVPGNFPTTPANELEKLVGINPMPAAENGVNPIKLAPGEEIPESIATEGTNQHVKLDKESYEKADALPGDVTAAATSLPPVSDNMIPESSLPIASSNDAHISTVTPIATTAALAADAPIETKKDVPEVVKESQEKAGADTKASGMSEEVKDKADVETELLEKVPQAPSAAEGTAGKGTDKKEGETTTAEAAAAVAGAAIAVGGAAFAAVTAAKDSVLQKTAETAADASEPAKEALPEKAKEAVEATSAEKTREEVSPEVPAEVKESIVDAKTSPEAAANTEAVADKREVETELLKEAEKAAPVEAKTETSGELSKPEERKAEQPAKAADESKPAPANGEAPAESTAGASTAASTSETTQAKKKKNRLSAMFSKVKSKMSSKH